MKNSLFKRAIAAVSAVPLALTQCLVTANAIEISDAASSVAANAVTAGEAKSVTLSDEGTGIVYIAPGKAEGATSDGYVRIDSETFEKYSDWNILAFDALSGKERTGQVKTDRLFNEIMNRTPENYKVVMEALLEKVHDCNYSIASNGDITITGSIDNITPRFTNDTKKTRKTIGGALYSIVKDYGASDLYNSMDEKGLWTDIKTGGTFTAVISSSALAEGTTVEAQLTFTDLDGKTIVGSDAMKDWALGKLADMKARAKELVAASASKYGIDVADANKRIDDSVKYYEDKLNFVETKIENAIAKEITETVYGTVPNLMAKGESWYNRNGGRVADKYAAPKSATEVASKEVVKDYYNDILNTFNGKQEKYSIDIALDEVASFIDGELYEVTASTSNGESVLTAKFADKEKDAAIAWISENYDDVSDNTSDWDSWKEVKVTVNFNEVPSASKASVDVQLKRVVKVTVPETTTTTVETTTDTTPDVTTETTPDVTTDTTPDVTTETTPDVTTETNPDVTTETTPDVTTETTPDVTTETTPDVTTETTPDVTTETNPDVTTETNPDVTTETTPDVTTETTPDVTTETNPDVTTETNPDVTTEATPDVTTETNPDVTTETNPDVTTETTPYVTTETTPDVTTETTPDVTTDTNPGVTTEPINTEITTRVVTETVVHYHGQGTVGFYLNIDEAFNKEQIKDLSYSIDVSNLYIDQYGDIVGDTVVIPGEKVSIADKVNFGDQVPNNVYVPGSLSFAHQVDVYAAEDLIINGQVIPAGTVLKNRNGSNVSVTAYVGLKGDGNLDNMADSTDASLVLNYYAKLSTGENSEVTQFSDSILVNSHEDTLDHFAAFLADVDNQLDPDNWSKMRPARLIDSTDASFILRYYSNTSTGAEGGKALWEEVLGINW